MLSGAVEVFQKLFGTVIIFFDADINSNSNKLLIVIQVRPSSGTADRAEHPHMPILRVACALDESASARATRTTVQNLTPLALSSAEKSSAVHTHTHKL